MADLPKFTDTGGVGGAVRILVAAGGGYLLGRGLFVDVNMDGVIDNLDVTAFAGAASVIVAGAWSIFNGIVQARRNKVLAKTAELAPHTVETAKMLSSPNASIPQTQVTKDANAVKARNGD